MEHSMKKKIIVIGLAFLSVLGVYFGGAFYALTTMNIEELLVVCLHSEKNHFC